MRRHRPLEFHDSAQGQYVPETCNGCKWKFIFENVSI